MKKLLFLAILTLSAIGLLYPQTNGQYKKLPQVGEDGFKWYRLDEGSLSGAADENGKIIVPVKFSTVRYRNGFFTVSRPNDGEWVESVYSVGGEVIIPESREYSFVTGLSQFYENKSNGIYFKVEKGAGKGVVYGMCNAKGEEIVPVSRGYQKVSLDKSGNTYWFHVVKDGKCGIVDLNGNEVVAPNESYKYIDVVTGGIAYSNKRGSLVYRKGSAYKEDVANEILLDIPLSRLSSGVDIDNFFGTKSSVTVAKSDKAVAKKPVKASSEMAVKTSAQVSSSASAASVSTSSVSAASVVSNGKVASVKMFEKAQDFLSFYNRSEKYPTHFGEKYNKALKYIKAGENEKAEKVFVSMLKIKKGSVLAGSNAHAVYQLYHYYRYGFYDKYYNGSASFMDRIPRVYIVVGNQRLAQEELLKALSDENRLLLSVSEMLSKYNGFVDDSWTIRRVYDDIIYKKQNFAKGDYVFRAETVNSSKIVSKDIVAISLLKVLYDNGCINKLNMYDILKAYSYSSWQTNQVDEHGGRYAFELAEECLEFLPYISFFEQHKNVYDIGKNANELYREAKRVKESNQQKYIYLLSRAALFGNTDALQDIYTAIKGSNMDSYHKSAFASGISQSKKLEHLKEYTKQHASYYKALNDKKEAEAKAAREAEWRREQARKEQRRENWRNVGLAVLQAVAETGAQMQQAMAANSYGTGYTGGYMGSYTPSPVSSAIAPNQSLNYLLDPNYAVAQVQQQDYAEYQKVRAGYQQMGKDITYYEYQLLQGETLMRMKEEGYDAVAEMRKLSEENDAFEEKWRQREKEDRNAKYEALLNGVSSSSSSSASSSSSYSSGSSSSSSSSSSTKSSSSSSYSSGSSIKSSSSSSYSSSSSSSSSGNSSSNLDSRQQFHVGKVSSDDYEYVKKVTLYRRDGSDYIVAFTGKELYKKGATYYVKMDNTFHKVQNQGHGGFSQMIVFGAVGYFFNK